MMTPDGMVAVPSRYSFAATLDRLEAAIAAKGLTLFCRIDFAADAARASLTMLPNKLLLFGNPVAGTPLMIATPSIAIDLPLKVLVSQDADGKVWASYNTPEYMRDRHHLPQVLIKNIVGIRLLVHQAVELKDE